MMWAASFSCQWRSALAQSQTLLAQSRWSPCLYSYLVSAHLIMIQDSGLSLTQEEEEELPRLMAAIPGLKQRIAGKSLPMEKYAIRKAERWTAQGGRLTLPGLELVYLWNGFSIMGLDYTRAERYLVTIEAEMEAAQRRRAAGGQEQFEVEDDCLLLLLKGMCLKYMSAPMGAEECFREVINKAGGEGARLKADKYLLPYATVELALILMEAGDNEEAASLLEAAKGYKEYSLQSRLHFRIHAAQNKILAGNNNNEEQEKVSEVYVVMSPLYYQSSRHKTRCSVSKRTRGKYSGTWKTVQNRNSENWFLTFKPFPLSTLKCVFYCKLLRKNTTQSTCHIYLCCVKRWYRMQPLNYQIIM